MVQVDPKFKQKVIILESEEDRLYGNCDSDSSESHWGRNWATRRKPAIDRYSNDPEIFL